MPEGLSSQTRLLVVAPHPDDETISSGQLIQHVRDVGGAVRVVLLTDGDNNPWPQRWLERRWRIDASGRQRWGERRREESAQAMQRLGVDAASITALGWPDGSISQAMFGALRAMVGALHAQLEAFQPNLLVIPALSDRHPDHGGVHVLMRLALQAWGGQVDLLSYMVHGAMPASAPPFRFPSSSDQLRIKLEAMELYHSQLLLSGRRMRRLAAQPEQFFVVEPERGEGILPWQPSSWLRRWLRVTLVGEAGAQDWAWHEAPLRQTSDGGWQVQANTHERAQFARLRLDWPSPWIFDHWGWCAL